MAVSIGAGPVLLNPDEHANITPVNSTETYQIPETTVLGALDAASRLGAFEYQVAEGLPPDQGNLSIISITGIENELVNETPYAWTYWVNGERATIGPALANVTDGDNVTYTYGPPPLTIENASYTLTVLVNVTGAVENVTPMPTGNVTPMPTGNVTPMPTGNVTPMPTENVTPMPTENVTPMPTGNVTPMPTENVTPMPTGNVTPMPTGNVTPMPTENVTLAVNVSDQPIVNSTVVVDNATINVTGWVDIHADLNGTPGPIIGYSPISEGVNENVTVAIEVADATPVLYAMLHIDAGEPGVHEFPGPDVPILVNGTPVQQAFNITGGLPGVNVTPTPTMNVTPTPTMNVTPTPTMNVTPTPTMNVTPTPTMNVTPTPTMNVTPTPTMNVTPTPTMNVTPTPTMNVTPTPTMNVTPTPTMNVTPTPTMNVTPTPTMNVTPTPTMNVTPTPTMNVTPTPTMNVTPTPTMNVTPTPTMNVTPTPTMNVTPTPTMNVTPTPTMNVTPTPTMNVTPTPTMNVTPTPTMNVTPTPTMNVTPTPTMNVTPTPTMNVTPTPTMNVTPTPTTTPPTENVTDQIIAGLSEEENLTTFIMVLNNSTLDQRLEENRTYVICAPTDDAFDGLGNQTLAMIQNDTTLLNTIIDYHVILGDYTIEDLIMLCRNSTNGQISLPTLEGTNVNVSITDDGQLIINNIIVVTQIQITNNIVIYVIDGVLIPPGTTIPTPTPTMNVTPTPTMNVTPTPTMNVTPTPTMNVTPTPTMNVTPTPTMNVTPTPTMNVTPTPTMNVTPTPTMNVTPTPTMNVTPTPTMNVTPTPTMNVTPTPTTTPSVPPAGETVDLELYEGWNFVSIPRPLSAENNTVAAVFDDVDMDGRSVYTFAPGTGFTPVGANTTLQVLEGYWVYSAGELTLQLDLSTNPMRPPAMKTLSPGWNAIGYSDLTPRTADETLKSVEDVWVYVVGFDAEDQSYRPALVNNQTGAQGENQRLSPTEGYWLFVRDDGRLAAISA